MSNEMFPEIEIVSAKNDFKTNVYITPRQDFKINVPREMHITYGTKSRSVFFGKSHSCSSLDRITGYDNELKENVDCTTCEYATKEGKSRGPNEDPIKCKCHYALFMEHENSEKQYALTSVNWHAFNKFNEYRTSLLKMDLDVNQVITKITRIEPPQGLHPATFMYEFEFVRELNLNMTDVEEDAIAKLKVDITNNGDNISVQDAASVIQIWLQNNNVEIDINRAKRLVNTLSDDGLIIKA